MRVFSLLAFTMLLHIGTVVQAQSVRSFATPDSLAIGDTFYFVITSQYNSTRYQAAYPDSTAFGDSFEYVSMRRYRGVQSRDSIVYRLQFFALQDTIMPPKTVQFLGGDTPLRVETLPVPLYFKSVLDPADAELRPIKPIFQFGRAIWPYLVGLLLLITALYLFWRYRDRFIKQATEPVPAPKEVPPFRNPLKTLADDLVGLYQFENFKTDHYREFYFLVSQAFRQYFEDVYKVLALESTTRELLLDLGRKGADERIIDLLKLILRRADLVKFAKFEARTADAAETIEQAEELVQLLRKADNERIAHLKYMYELENGLRKPDDAGKPKAAVLNPLVHETYQEKS